VLEWICGDRELSGVALRDGGRLGSVFVYVPGVDGRFPIIDEAGPLDRARAPWTVGRSMKIQPGGETVVFKDGVPFRGLIV
jgi:hypothetical protein